MNGSGFRAMPPAVAPRCLALAAALALAACGRGHGGDAAATAVARVNGYEITADHVASELSTAAGQGLYPDGSSPRQALDRLIDRQLLVQEAIEAGLDRDPQVKQSLDNAYRQLLVEAYLERVLAVPSPDAAEIGRFYVEHPALFRQRRVYFFREFVIPRAEYTNALRGVMDAVRAPADMDAALGLLNITYYESASARSAEQLPIDLLPRFLALGRGRIAALERDRDVVLMQLLDYTEEPIELGQATPYIQRYLVNSQRKRLTEDRLAELRNAARIAYLAPLPGAAGGGGPQTGIEHRPAVPGPTTPGGQTAGMDMGRLAGKSEIRANETR